MTGNQIINEALLVDNVIYVSQTTISPEAQATCELGLNNMLSEWNAQGRAIFSIIRKTFSLDSGTGDYTIGTGADLDTPRPEKIEAWSVITTSGAAGGGKPVDAPTFVANAEDRSAIGSVIKMLNYDAAFPTGSIHLYPKPNGGTLELWVWEQMATITDFTLDITFPPGYMKAIIYNLAIDLAPKFGRPVDPAVKMIADQTKQTLGGTNTSENTRANAPAAQPAA